MEQVVDLHEVAENLQTGFRRAADQGLPAVRVQMRVPFESQYEWRDDYGAPRSVHLPTDVIVEPAASSEQRTADSGPAATFSLQADGSVPDATVTEQLAAQLFQRAVLWGQDQYGTAEPLGEHVEPVPSDIEPLVDAALNRDVQS